MYTCDPWSREPHRPVWKEKYVGVDFDETISDNPETWMKVMVQLEDAGYTVVVVTWRSPDTYPEDLQFLVDRGWKVYYTSFKAKRPYMESLGIKIDIVIDDNPWAWDHDATEIWSDPRIEIEHEGETHERTN